LPLAFLKAIRGRGQNRNKAIVLPRSAGRRMRTHGMELRMAAVNFSSGNSSLYLATKKSIRILLRSYLVISIDDVEKKKLKEL
jgi:hypothetical protein